MLIIRKRWRDIRMYVGTLYFLLNVYPKTAQRLQSIKKKSSLIFSMLLIVQLEMEWLHHLTKGVCKESQNVGGGRGHLHLLIKKLRPKERMWLSHGHTVNAKNGTRAQVFCWTLPASPGSVSLPKYQGLAQLIHFHHSSDCLYTKPKPKANPLKWTQCLNIQTSQFWGLLSC